ncbi:MAG: hypothetical protein PHS49_01615 [Candidatus Gracilibacteria bacterium]|nr:hypothetical protein [Candidatus Gracilibacteria bacterium]
MNNSKKCLSDKTKCGLLVVSFLVFLSVIFYYGRFDIMGVSANPDYICTRVMTGQSCNFSEANCGPWSTDGKRVCNGKRNIKTYYYNRRSSCAAGYSSVHIGDSDGNSGRTTGDYYVTENCTVIQEDNIAPVGEIQ